jgi:hypothetical protein
VKAVSNLKFTLYPGIEWCAECCSSQHTSGQEQSGVSQPLYEQDTLRCGGNVALGIDGDM